jgi:competence protein ComGC
MIMMIVMIVLRMLMIPNINEATNHIISYRYYTINLSSV